MIQRQEYMNNLISFKDKELIKVVTGIRRCGKSTLFDLYCEYLREQGVGDNRIIRINLEDPDFDFKTYKELYDYVKNKLVDNEMNYVFIDEVQTVPEFERACDGLYIKKNVDLYITGSNAYLLSGELATLLSGRYVEIKMLPLSFKEYTVAFPNEQNMEKLYSDYVFKSSFPYAVQLKTSKEIKQYLDSLYDSIFIKDIVTRKNFSDVGMLKSVSQFVFDNIGNITSANKISDTMTSMGRKISFHTVENYLSALTDSFIFQKADRYDIKGKTILKTGEKYYATDVGIRYNIFGKKNVDRGHILENIVYLELIRKGYQVYIGKVGENEVDFIVIGEYGEEYYQVAYTTMDEKTLERELKSLDSIRDHNPKYLLTMDIEPITSYNGIKKINVLDWLLDKNK